MNLEALWGPLAGLPIPVQALAAGLFTWGVTGLGALSVVFTRRYSRKLLDGLMGGAAGVMIAASFWSLLSPAIDLAEQQGFWPWFWPALGFLSGGAFLWGVDRLLPHLHVGFNQSEGPKTHWHRSVLLVTAITLHNIPEGLAVGVAFGAAGLGLAPLAGALALTLGIGLQNFPEGAAVALPLRREGFSRRRAFFYGQASGVVEPLAALVGAWAVTQSQALLPFALSFAAGAMIFVVVEELIPESQIGGNTDLATLSTLLGFTVMMVLDVALG